MLSKQERRAFAEIAEQVVADDPQFAASMRALQSSRPGRGHAVVVVLAAATAVLCLLLLLAGPCLMAAALAFGAYGLRPRRPERRPLRRRCRRA
jgi:hypothetical protein